MSVFLPQWATCRGNLRSAGISRFIAKPLRLHWSPSLASASFGRLLLRWSTILGYYRLDSQCFTKNLWGLPMLAWLLRCRCPTRCCLRPRGVGVALVSSVPVAWPAPDEIGSARSQNYEFSELRVRFRATPFTSPHSLISRVACATLPYTTGRLTKPYPGRPAILWIVPAQLATIARLPSPSHLPNFILSRLPQACRDIVLFV